MAMTLSQRWMLNYRRGLQVLVHVGLWATALLVAFLLRFEFSIPEDYFRMGLLSLGVLATIKGVSFGAFGMFSGMWRYTGGRDLVALFKAATLSTVLFSLVLLLGGVRNFPRSILVIDWLLTMMLVGGLRFGIRTLWQLAGNVARDNKLERKRSLIVGAGNAGEMLVREMQKLKPARYEPVAFIDDDPRKRGSRIHGIPVVAGIAGVAEIARSTRAEEIVIAIPSASGKQMREIVERCKVSGLPIRTIPGIDQVLDGSVTVNQLRSVDIEDLLGREPVKLDTRSIAGLLQGRVVMVTGAGGSIGSELCRQICRFKPSRLLLVERSENALFEVHRELLARFPAVDVVPCIADICDAPRMTQLFQSTRPTVLLHAAAHKHVPMMEWNPGEAIKNNVGGTRALAELADRFGVERFVMISTDKAVNPTSIMGATKRVAELCVQGISGRSKTVFVAVRFGNVLGSAGSVVPIFREQIEKGGPVLVTHPEMRRYFMTIPEASQLVLQAGTMGKGGEIFMLDMGEPVKIVDLARDLITLSGLRPELDIEIKFTGVRPGEKLFEELSTAEENADKTLHPKIFIGRLAPRAAEVVAREIEALVSLAESGSAAALVERMKTLVPELQRSLPAAQSAGADVIPIKRPA